LGVIRQEGQRQIQPGCASDGRGAGQAEAWKKVWERVRTHQMPPPERAQPTFAERQRIVAWIEDTFIQATIDVIAIPALCPRGASTSANT